MGRRRTGTSDTPGGHQMCNADSAVRVESQNVDPAMSNRQMPRDNYLMLNSVLRIWPYTNQFAGSRSEVVTGIRMTVNTVICTVRYW